MSVYEQIFNDHGFSATQVQILKLVGLRKIVLEIGASSGYMTKAFLQNGCVVDAVELDENALIKIPKKVRKLIKLSIENEKIYQKLARDYEFIVLADVLEHLVDPKKVLEKLYKIATNKTKLLISVPNIAGWPIRKQLFFEGDFKYQESGPLDKTHLHFYTVDTLRNLLLETGWKVEEVKGTITRLPFEGSMNKVPVVGWIYRQFIRQTLVERFKNLSYYHFLSVSTK